MTGVFKSQINWLPLEVPGNLGNRKWLAVAGYALGAASNSSFDVSLQRIVIVVIGTRATAFLGVAKALFPLSQL
jgi:hypothetical protein